MALSTPVAPTGVILTDALLGGARWTNPVLTYSFPAQGSFYEAAYGGDNEPNKNFQPLTNNASMVSATRYAYAQYAAVAGLTFTEVTETAGAHAIMRNAYAVDPNKQEPTLAWAYFPSEDPSGGDAWYNNANSTDNTDARMGSNDWSTVLHEVGHALGLKHPHEASDGFPVMPAAFDNFDYTVMSYRSYSGAALANYTNETFGYNQTLMSLDVSGIQALYGANYSTNNGDTTYRFSAATGEMFVNGVGQGAPVANRVYRTLWDGGGIDTYDLSNYDGGSSIDLRPGGWMTFSPEQLVRLRADGTVLATGNVANSLLFNGNVASLIENVITGAGNDVVIGNVADNLIQAGDGIDIVYAGDGDDRIFGGAGVSSILVGEAGNDTIFGGEGNDYCVGGAGNDVLVGLGGQDSLYGGDGNDYLVAGDGVGCVVDGGAGANSLWGAGGNDYVVGGEGADLVVGSGGSDYEFGNAGDDTLYGGQGTDYLYTNAGNDFVWTDDAGLPASTDYVYAGGGTGVDTVADFTAGSGPNADVLVISPASGIGSFAQAQGAMSQQGVYTVLNLGGGDAVYLYNVSSFQMTAGNFLFF